MRYLALLLLAACDGETSIEHHRLDARPLGLASDAATPAFDAGVLDAGPFDAGHPDAAAWLAAPTFSVSLDSSSCYGTCPQYWVRIDGAGKLSYRGLGYTARPGYYEIDLPAADAQALRQSLIDAGFLGLQDSYQTEADGCSSVWTDAPTKTFRLETGEQTKQVVFYEGCQTPAAWLFARLEKQIMRATQVGRFLYPAPNPTCMRMGAGDLAESWVITSGTDGGDLGLLRLERNYTWKVTTCDGLEIASGDADLHINWDRLLLAPRQSPGPIAWPGTEGPQGVVLLSRTYREKWLAITALNLTEQQKQYAYEGDHCGGRKP